jgi:hypothetical protein
VEAAAANVADDVVAPADVAEPLLQQGG